MDDFTEEALIILHQWCSTRGDAHCNICSHCECYKMNLYSLSYLSPFTMESQGDILFVSTLHRFINLLSVCLRLMSWPNLINVSHSWSFYAFIVLEIVEQGWETRVMASFTFNTLHYTFNFSTFGSIWDIGDSMAKGTKLAHC